MQNETEDKNWYEAWFDSSYYHILYKNRDGEEAKKLLNNLVLKQNLKPGMKVMDLCCGKGRHARYLNSIGFDVTGIDLSPKNIEYCKKFENETLHFYEQDMRQKFRDNYFDSIFNLFTSFGYFNDDKENEQSILAAVDGLKTGGCLVIDFLNVARVEADLKPYEIKVLGEIEFHIRKKIENGFIYKRIAVVDGANEYTYTEQVRTLKLSDFQHYFKAAHLNLLHVYGDYDMNDYKSSSNRLLLIAQKN